jgi:hypothetical protein
MDRPKIPRQAIKQASAKKKRMILLSFCSDLYILLNWSSRKKYSKGSRVLKRLQPVPSLLFPAWLIYVVDIIEFIKFYQGKDFLKIKKRAKN